MTRGDLMSLLEIKHLKKSFGDNVVLKDISLSIDKGEVLAIIGPSGSKKDFNFSWKRTRLDSGR